MLFANRPEARRREHGVVALDRVDRASQGDGATAVHVGAWIAEHRPALDEGRAGPLLDGELRVLVVAGRGPRRDYHVNTVAELFYQLDGDMSVLVGEPGSVREVEIRTGELWLAPAGVPHSPQRPIGTTGLVIERPREPGTTESFRWYCERCGTIVDDIVMERVDPLELRRAMTAFYADEAARTCPSCGTVVRPPGA